MLILKHSFVVATLLPISFNVAVIDAVEESGGVISSVSQFPSGSIVTVIGVVNPVQERVTFPIFVLSSQISVESSLQRPLNFTLDSILPSLSLLNGGSNNEPEPLPLLKYSGSPSSTVIESIVNKGFS